jgi:flagellar motor switch protein FliG
MSDAQPPAQPLRMSQSGTEKAAVFLLSLGPEAAANVAKHLSEPELIQISNAIARMRVIPRAQAAVVQEEAWNWLSSRAGMLVDGSGFVSKLLELAPPASKQQEMLRMRELAQQRTASSEDSSIMARFQSVAPATLANTLESEHPQVVAFVLANLEAQQSAETLKALPEDVQAEVLRRIADLQSSASPELVAALSDILHEQLQGVGGGGDGGPGAAGVQAGGTKMAAEIMNLLDEAVGQRVFGYLDEQVPEMAEAIRNQMFTFDDLIRLDNKGLQLVLKEVPREDLLLALKTASPPVKEKIFANMSARAVEIMQDDLSSMGPVRLKDVEKSQANVILVVRRLADEQKIQLGGGGDAVV